MLTRKEHLAGSQVLTRWIGCILVFIISFCLSGCWDRRELQERHFVLAVAIDSAEKGEGGKGGGPVAEVEEFVQPHGTKRYRLSLQLLQLMPSGNTEERRGTTGMSIISTTGESMDEMIWDLLGQSDKKLWFEHVQAIVISDAAVKQGGLGPIFDFYHRNEEIRWLTKVAITSGEARSLLEYKPPSGEVSGMFIANSLRMYAKSSHIPGWHTDLGDMSTSAENKRRVLIPRIELSDNMVKLGGTAIFKEEKFIDYIDEYATQGNKFLSGTAKSAIVTFECPKHPGRVLTFELFSQETKLRPHVEGDKIYYTLDILMKGNIGEMQCSLEHDTIEAEDLHKLELQVAKAVTNNVMYTFHTFQNMKVDGSVFAQKLQAYEPLVWESLKERWDEEVFPNLPLTVSVNVVIENVGSHK